MQWMQVPEEQAGEDPGRFKAARCGRVESFGIEPIGSYICIPTLINGGGVGFIIWPDTRPRPGRKPETAEGPQNPTEING